MSNKSKVSESVQAKLTLVVPFRLAPQQITQRDLIANTITKPTPSLTISQAQLAEISDLEAQLAALQEELDARRRPIFVALEQGAGIEPGPFKAWFSKTLVVR